MANAEGKISKFGVFSKWFAYSISLLVFGLAAFRFQLAEISGGSILLLPIWALVALLYLLAFLTVTLSKKFIPAACMIAVALAVFFLPLADIGIRGEFYLFQGSRERIVESISKGQPYDPKSCRGCGEVELILAYQHHDLFFRTLRTFPFTDVGYYYWNSEGEPVNANNYGYSFEKMKAHWYFAVSQG